MDNFQRDCVIVLGGASFDEHHFSQRNLYLRRESLDSAPKLFSLARGILIVDHPGQYGLIKNCLATLLPNAADYGLVPIIIAQSNVDAIAIASIKKTSTESPSRIIVITRLWEAADVIARHNAGPAAGDVAIASPAYFLNDDQRLLLRRAFSDCERLHLELMPGGMASAAVFKAHAWLREHPVGPSPLPFFVKLADPKSIDEERQKYELYADHYIPFNLRPNVTNKRCVQTRSTAALVGNFVDDAMELRASLRSGHGIGALFSLFESTLKRFRLQPFAKSDQPLDGVLGPFIKNRADISMIPADIIDRARQLGLKSSPNEIMGRLLECANKRKCYWGPYHGDMHAKNVMVRGSDAIVIDFFKTDDGPLTADPATLEVNLCFATDTSDKPDDFVEWKSFIDEIYREPVATLHPSSLYDLTPHPYAWLRRSLRELRHVLMGCHPQIVEAHAVLAAHLLRYGRLEIEHPVDSPLRELAFNRHSYALVIAERLSEACARMDSNESSRK